MSSPAGMLWNWRNEPRSEPTHDRPLSGTLTFPESGRSFNMVGDADHRRSVARGDARLLGSAYADAATHNRFPA